MIKNLSAPLKIEFANVGESVVKFVPYRENQMFSLNAGEKLSFDLDKSEVALYYERQATKDLFVGINNTGASSVGFGAYNATSGEFTSGSSYNAVLVEKTESVEDSVKTETFKYNVIGTVPYTAAQPAIGMAAGPQFATHIVNKDIESKSDLPSGTICTVTVTPGTSFSYNKNAFEDDGSLISVENILAQSNVITISVKWSDELVCIYVFEFKEAKIGTEGQEVKELKDIEIKLPQKVLLSNISEGVVSFVPYKENFAVDIAAGNSIELEAIRVEEVIYYLLQANDKLNITL